MTPGLTGIEEQTNRRCPACHAIDRWREKTVDVSHVISGHEFVGAVSARECMSCGHVLHDRAAEDRLCLRIAALIVDSGLATGRAFRFMRKAIAMRASDLARLLQVAPETISRWETERRAVDPSSFALLAAIVRDRLEGRTAVLDGLERLVKPLELPRTTRVPAQLERHSTAA
jgi:DNA-binding transcriptional regulator YiaG